MMMQQDKLREAGDAHGWCRNNDSTAARTIPDAVAMSARVPPSHAAESRTGSSDRPGKNGQPNHLEIGRGTREIGNWHCGTHGLCPSGATAPIAHTFPLQPMPDLAPWCLWPMHACVWEVAIQLLVHSLVPNSPCCCSMAHSDGCSNCPNSDPQRHHSEAAGRGKGEGWIGEGGQSSLDICHHCHHHHIWPILKEE